MTTTDAVRADGARRTRITVHPALALAMITAGALHAIGGAISPGLRSSASGQLAVIDAHPTRWYWYTMLLVAGSVLAIPAVIGLLQLGRARMRRVGTIGGALVALGFVGSVIDCANQLWSWQMVQHAANRSQMAALLNHFDNSAGSDAPFAVTGIGLLVGTVLLTVALVRNPAVPTLPAVAFGAAVFVNIVAFAANNVPGVTASFVLLLIGLGWIGLSQLVREGEPRD